jgi:hypothetical protein
VIDVANILILYLSQVSMKKYVMNVGIKKRKETLPNIQK